MPVIKLTMKSKKILLPIAVLIVSLSCAFVWIHDPGDQIAALLTRYATRYPQEKVHLHLDRNYYAAGDTLNFKAYVVTAANNELSDTSKILYVNLADANQGYFTTLSYRLDAGTASGTIEIPDTLKAGNYTISAYTNWMKNFGQEYFYHAGLKIGRTGDNGTTAPKDIAAREDQIYFFPEGGNLVDQLVSVIGFKAVDNQGKGTGASGTVVDESGKNIVSFRSAYSGMGRFNLKPESGHHYTAVVKFSDGTAQNVPLPQIAGSGYVLTVDNQDRNEIRVTVSYRGKAAGHSALLIAQANHQVINITNVSFVNNTASIALKRRDFPTGITQLTLFDAAGEPTAERLIFVNRQDQLRLQLTGLKAATAGTSQKVTLQVTDALANPVNGEFSVAVLDQSLVGDSLKIPSIMADLLLTSDLKGTVENPDDYFNNKAPETVMMLDNLMITQGWRRFKWKDLLTGKDPLLLYPAEKEQTLRGTLRSKNNQPVPNGKILLVSKAASAFTLTSFTDSQGHFIFNLPGEFEQQQFNLIASDASGNSDVKITIDSQGPVLPQATERPAFLPATAENHLKSYLKVKEEFFNTGSPQPRQLKEVQIKSKQVTLTEKALAASANLNGAGNADQVLTYKDLNNCSDLEICLQGKLTGVYFKTVKDPNSNAYKKVPYSAGGMDKPMLVVLDGVPVPAGMSTLNNISAVNVQSIEVLRTGSKLVVYGMEASGGALIITTKKGGIDYNAINEPGTNSKEPVSGFMTLSYNGYHKSREFYNPPASAQGGRNSRSPETVFWKAHLRSNDDGQATFEFVGGSNLKKAVIIIEGLSADGKIGYLYQQQTF